jgi:hypothetical protein
LRTSRKQFIWLGCLLLTAVVLYVFGPVFLCWYKAYRFDHSLRVQIEVSPPCGEVSSVPITGTCQYTFSFDGEQDPRAIQFVGDGLSHSYDSSSHAYTVNGIGRIIRKNSVIELGSSRVFFNNQTMPQAIHPILAVVTKDGRLLSGYCESRW